MNDQQRKIYQTDGDRYEALIAREDYQGNIVKALDEIVNVDGLDVLDLGAGKCVPCKMMAPILEKLKKTYEGRAAIIFIDVWKNIDPARQYGIRAIPTQIFFDAGGREVHRHVGFMSEKDIVQQLTKMGVN